MSASPASARPDGGPAKPNVVAPWTPERVRTFIVNIERRFDQIWEASHPDNYWEKKLPTVGACYGKPARGLLKVSRVMPQVEAMITGKALPCYVATYLGCTLDGWL